MNSLKRCDCFRLKFIKFGDKPEYLDALTANVISATRPSVSFWNGDAVMGDTLSIVLLDDADDKVRRAIMSQVRAQSKGIAKFDLVYEIYDIASKATIENWHVKNAYIVRFVPSELTTGGDASGFNSLTIEIGVQYDNLVLE